MGKGRTLVIGDLHGGLKGLTQALERANVTQNDEIIFLGDYVDGWCDSAPLITYLIRLKRKNRCIFLFGNHDAWCLKKLEFGVHDAEWEKRGGLTTMASYKKFGMFHNMDHLAFFKKLDYYYIDDQNRLFVHGGYSSSSGVKGEFEKKNLYTNRTLYYNALRFQRAGLLKIPRDLRIYKEVFIGHTTTLLRNTDQPINVYNLWNVDTGAGTNGKITVMDVDTKEYWQSDTLTSLYPNDPHNDFAKIYKRELKNEKHDTN